MGREIEKKNEIKERKNCLNFSTWPYYQSISIFLKREREREREREKRKKKKK